MKHSLLFDDYRMKLTHQEKYLQLLLYNQSTKKFYLYKPKMKSIYGTLNQKTNYYKALRNKLKLSKQNSDKKISFVTLTYDTKLYSPKEVLNRCKRDMQLFLKMVRNRIGQLHYFWIVELTKKKYVHFHMIVKEYIPAKIIRSCWRQTTGSIIIHVKGVSRTVASRYISKYVSEASKLSDDHVRFLYDNNFNRIYASSREFFAKRTKMKGTYKLLGIITAMMCIVKADSGEFLELEPITVKYFVGLMREDRWGYKLQT